MGTFENRVQAIKPLADEGLEALFTKTHGPIAYCSGFRDAKDAAAQVTKIADIELARCSAQAERFARALVDFMAAHKDHDIQSNTGLPQAECDVIAEARREAVSMLKGE